MSYAGWRIQILVHIVFFKIFQDSKIFIVHLFLEQHEHLLNFRDLLSNIRYVLDLTLIQHKIHLF